MKHTYAITGQYKDPSAIKRIKTQVVNLGQGRAANHRSINYDAT